jgi:hypothetical protein
MVTNVHSIAMRVRETGVVVYFFDKGNILISRDTNYIRPLQQHNTLTAVWMHTAKKMKKKLRK